jgi:hypothetical protein
MAKQRRTAHAALDELRQAAANERMKQRELVAALEAAKAEVEQASAAIADGYAAEDERAVTQARKTEEAAVADVRELQHRVDGAALRSVHRMRSTSSCARMDVISSPSVSNQPGRWHSNSAVL